MISVLWLTYVWLTYTVCVQRHFSYLGCWACGANEIWIVLYDWCVLTCSVCVLHHLSGAGQEVPTAVDGRAVPGGGEDG